MRHDIAIASRAGASLRESETGMGTTKKLIVTIAVVGTLILGSSVASAAPAEAATVRTGARWDHLDVLLTREETASVARGITGGASVCWKVGAAAAGLGLTRGPAGAFFGAVTGGGACVAAVTTCAGQAYAQGRRAGMTFSPAWYGVRYWCWTY